MFIIKGHALIHVVKASIIVCFKSGMSGGESREHTTFQGTLKNK